MERKMKRPKLELQQEQDYVLLTEIQDPRTTACIRVNGPSTSCNTTTEQQVLRQPMVVLTRKANSDTEARPGRSPSSSLLQDLLYPLDAQTFLERCLGECAVHVAASLPTKDEGAVRHRLSHLADHYLFGLDPLSILKETSSECIFVWLQKQAAAAAPAPAGVGASTSDDPNNTPRGGSTLPSRKQLIHSIEVSDPNDAWQLHEAGGHATYCRAPPALEQALVSSLLRDTGLGCGQYDPTGESRTCLGRGEVEVFLTSSINRRTPGQPHNDVKATTGWHYDFQENFTLQLSGVKRWRVQKGTVRAPVARGCTPHYNAPEAVESQLLAARLAHRDFLFGEPVQGQNAVGEVEVVTLRPGDVFYFPAGMWHTVDVVEPGVSINISLMATNYASVTCQALQHVLLRKEEWRRPVQSKRAGGSAATTVVDELQALLRTLPDIIRDFERNSGAEAILPPVLHHPKAEAAHDGTDPGSDSGEDDVSDDNDNEEEEEVVRVSKFEFPPSWRPKTITEDHQLLRNPLATLLSEDQSIKRFYYGHTINSGRTDEAQGSGDSSNSKDDEEVFLLNVNFAGNDAQESTVRVRLSANARAVAELENMLDSREDAVPFHHSAARMYKQNRELIDCLVFHGYLLWKDPQSG